MSKVDAFGNKLNKRENIQRGFRKQAVRDLAEKESRDAIREYQMGSACPLLASSPVARIVREVTTARNDRFRVLYADGQSVDIYARPDSTDARILEIANAL